MLNLAGYLSSKKNIDFDIFIQTSEREYILKYVEFTLKMYRYSYTDNMHAQTRHFMTISVLYFESIWNNTHFLPAFIPLNRTDELLPKHSVPSAPILETVTPWRTSDFLGVKNLCLMRKCSERKSSKKVKGKVL